MNPLRITVQSVLDGNASGYISFQVPSDCTIKDLLNLYCTEKGIQVASNYILVSKENVVLNPLKTLIKEGIHNGESVKLDQFDKKEQLFAFGSWWIIIGLAFLIGCVGLVYSLFLLYFPLKVPQKYGLVIDAGSTHSQLFVFKLSKINSKEIADIELIHDCMMPGGVADYHSHTQDLHKYFSSCISEAENLIPVSLRPNTPLILAATAGMRILRAYDPDGAAHVLSSIREIFLSKTQFLIKQRDVFVTSGQQEGINGWTAINYLMENFQETEKDSQEASALDLGGASVQVTTELSNETNQWPIVNITIFRNTYRIFSKSFLCYGIGEAKHRYQYLLISSSNKKSKIIDNPCLPKGFHESFTSEDFFNPCIFSNQKDLPSVTGFQRSRYSKRFVRKYVLEDGVNNKLENISDVSVENEDVYILKGTSETVLCRKKVESLFDYELCKSNFILGDCLNKLLIPPYNGELVGFSSIFLKLFPLLGVSQEGSLTEYKDAILSKCSMTGEELFQLHPNVSQEMLEDLCFDGMYVYTLLNEGLGITSKRWENILFTNKVNEQDVVWAMGLMLNRTSGMKMEPKAVRIDRTSFSLLTLLFVAFLCTSLLLILYTMKIRQRGNIYQRVHTTVIAP